MVTKETFTLKVQESIQLKVSPIWNVAYVLEANQTLNVVFVPFQECKHYLMFSSKKTLIRLRCRHSSKWNDNSQDTQFHDKQEYVNTQMSHQFRQYQTPHMDCHNTASQQHFDLRQSLAAHPITFTERWQHQQHCDLLSAFNGSRSSFGFPTSFSSLGKVL